MPINSGAIPGENFTSDTKNYPWHQPPEFTDINKALDVVGKKLTEFKRANSILTMVEMGVPLTRVADMIVTAGIGEGKWTPDFALLIAGPVTRMIELICIGFDVEYTLGIEEDEDDFVTSTFFSEDKKLKDNSSGFELVKEELPGIKQEAEAAAGDAPEGDLKQSGFMAMQAPQDQAAEEEA
jgi:hypothetical protein